MSINSLGQYETAHKTWDHVGNLIPDIEYSEGERPHGEWKPAAWLPVQFFDKYTEEWFVCLPGKIVATDNQNRVVPAQYGLGSATITYTDNDVTAGVIDVRTGAALLSSATGTFNVSAVTDFMGGGETMAVSRPIGVSPYGWYQWAGDGSSLDDGFNPAAYRRHNHNLQHRVALLCDYVIELPLVPATAASVALANASFDVGLKHLTFTALSNLPVATNTVRTPITFSNNALSDAATRFAVQKDALADVLRAGDWYINLVTGVVTAYAASDPGGGATAYSIVYSHYASAPSGSNVSKFACALGDLNAGDFLVCNADSNWVVATPKTYGTANGDNFHTFADIMGQVLEVENVKGKDALDRVRTAYSPAINTSATGSYPGYTGQMDQMPGTATGGVPDKLHYAGAADLVVRINLVSR